MPDRSLTARGEATRQRIIDAATAEFARHGLAGARVDRIMETARTNKAQLYGYFGSKQRLFDAVFFESLDRIVDAVPIDSRDLPGWAVRLYNQYLAQPELIRLATWRRMELSPVGRLHDDVARRDEEKLRAIAEAQAEGVVGPGAPYDVMALVIAMSMAWSPVSNVYAATADEAAAEHDRRRAFLRDAVRRAIAPE